MSIAWPSEGAVCLVKDYSPMQAYITAGLDHSCQQELVDIEGGSVAEVENQWESQAIRTFAEILFI